MGVLGVRVAPGIFEPFQGILRRQGGDCNEQKKIVATGGRHVRSRILARGQRVMMTREKTSS